MMLLCSSEVKDTLVVRIYQSRGAIGSLLDQILLELYLCKVLIIMAWNRAPYIHIILADVVSIT